MIRINFDLNDIMTLTYLLNSALIYNFIFKSIGTNLMYTCELLRLSAIRDLFAISNVILIRLYYLWIIVIYNKVRNFT